MLPWAGPYVPCRYIRYVSNVSYGGRGQSGRRRILSGSDDANERVIARDDGGTRRIRRVGQRGYDCVGRGCRNASDQRAADSPFVSPELDGNAEIVDGGRIGYIGRPRRVSDLDLVIAQEIVRIVGICRIRLVTRALERPRLAVADVDAASDEALEVDARRERVERVPMLALILAQRERLAGRRIRRIEFVAYEADVDARVVVSGLVGQNESQRRLSVIDLRASKQQRDQCKSVGNWI